MTTKGEVETAVRQLNAAAKGIGLKTRFMIQWGNRSAGRTHVLEEYADDLALPYARQIGMSYNDAHRFISGATHALEGVRRSMVRRVGIPPSTEAAIRRNATDEPEAVDWDAYPHNQAG